MNNEYSSKHQMGPYPRFIIFAILSFFPLLGFILSIVAIFVSYTSYVYDGYPLSYTLFLFFFINLVAIY